MPELLFFKETTPCGLEVMIFVKTIHHNKKLLPIILSKLYLNYYVLAFERCVRDPYCAARAVNQYIQRYAKV
jgi:hypothetical protein